MASYSAQQARGLVGMPPSAPDPLLYTLFKGSFAAAEAREPRHAAAARDAVLSWGSSSSAWSLLWRETGGRADYAPAAEVSSQATSCRQRRPVACTVDTFVQAAVNGGGGFLQVRVVSLPVDACPARLTGAWRRARRL